MSGDTGRQSSSEVAHEAEDTRAHLASTLEQLRNNLRPENVMEEVVSNARIGAASVADSIAGVARQYPIPALLAAAASAVIAGVFTRRPAKPAVTGYEAAAGIDGPSAGPSRTRFVPPRPPLLRNPSRFIPAPDRDATSSVGASLADMRDGLVGSLSAGASALKRQAADTYGSTSSQAGDAMQSMSRYIPHARSEVKSKLSTLLDEQPLILGAIGLAVGAAIGAALPITETEDSLMGSTAHRFRDSATEAARHEVDGLRAAAGEAIDNVRHSASDNLKTVMDKAGETFAPGSQDV